MQNKTKFKFDPRVKDGYFIADYFKKTVEILKNFKHDQIITMQFFQRNDNVVLCGISEVIDLLKFASPNYDDLEIYALNDGDIINSKEPVLKITGKYQDFGWLEGMIDGILSRNTSIATNSKQIIDAANHKDVLNMLDRADNYLTLASDGYASYIGGFRLFVTQASLEYIDDKTVLQPSGTMPHALIQAFNGDTLKAADAFYKTYPNNKLVVLIDYDNDCVNMATKIGQHFKEKLYAVRLDTSENLVDKFFINNKEYINQTNLNGVSEQLVREVRKALDNVGCNHTKIIVSSSFSANKIKEFENKNVPVDIYGVGSALAKINIHFTGDAVLINNQKQAKFGRENIENLRLKKVK
ncbi:nicotinate phosphoribosyltransferase [Mycoplasma mycoides]|uniref:nicotinate phosphoribosyltransferase n=1 Tax=Mycoplasma mycoides TaxID=2102 RepID=UPI00223F8A02|nr:nicotinate phosphoribosyltransferase [Mycoplasma mycoides]QVK02567.1 nicotinate phosphoribosyltransferase [Mycoplasma mycoides subsp. capri]QVK03382.1 nicotinate phosphoribosyltransferase [Mycoplasma mycoides subsp. capri]